MNGDEGGIRTHGTLARSPVFKTGAFKKLVCLLFISIQLLQLF